MIKFLQKREAAAMAAQQPLLLLATFCVRQSFRVHACLCDCMRGLLLRATTAKAFLSLDARHVTGNKLIKSPLAPLK